MKKRWLADGILASSVVLTLGAAPFQGGEPVARRVVSYIFCGGGRRFCRLVRRDFFISQAPWHFLADGFDREESGNDRIHREGYGGE